MIPKNSLTSNPEIIELTIDSLSYHGGRGVGRFEGVVVFVGDVVPGDVVRARVTQKKTRLWEAELVEVLKPSPERREPPCPVAGRCGGCSWQQVSYPEQIRQKEKILNDSLRALKKYGEWRRLPLLASPREFHYRNRIQLHFENGRSGFFAKRSRALVPTDRCLIAEEPLNEKWRELKGADGAKIEIALNENGEVLVMAGERDPEAALFAQVNTAQNEVMKRRMLELIEVEADWLMDLYSGSGNLTFPLAERFPNRPMHAIELSRRATERGQSAARARGLAHLKWIAADVGAGLRGIKKPEGRGLVVLDPPRTGADQRVTDELKRLHPRQILYVSCNPTTFARDAERLVRDGKYRLDTVQGLDMFPQTEHVELIASLCAAT